MPTVREERLKEELKESAAISPKTGKGNKVHFSLLRSTMLTFKRLSLILRDAAKGDFLGEGRKICHRIDKVISVKAFPWSSSCNLYLIEIRKYARLQTIIVEIVWYLLEARLLKEKTTINL